MTLHQCVDDAKSALAMQATFMHDVATMSIPKLTSTQTFVLHLLARGSCSSAALKAEFRARRHKLTQSGFCRQMTRMIDSGLVKSAGRIESIKGRRRVVLYYKTTGAGRRKLLESLNFYKELSDQ